MRFLRVIAITASIIGGCAILILVVTGLLWNAFLRDMVFRPPPHSALDPPIYPNAQQVKVVNKGDGSKTITFQTPDKPEAVLAFYVTVLRKDRWVHPLMGNDYPDNIFEWDQSGPDGPTDLAYRLTVLSKATDDRRTDVEIDLLRYNPIQ